MCKYQQYTNELASVRYSLRQDGVWIDRRGLPKCYNPVFQDLVTRQQDGEKLSYLENELYGQLLWSLAAIVIKNTKFRHQDPEIKFECKAEMVSNVLEKALRNYDPTKGAAYSYCYRLMYTAAVHVLEAMDDRRALDRALSGDIQVGDSGSDFRTRDSGDILDFGRKVNTAYSDMAYC